MNGCSVAVFSHWFSVHLKEKLQEDFPETAGKNTEACLRSINIFNDSSFTHFLEFLKICSKSFHFFFAKTIDLCLLTEKNQTLKGVIGRNIALWQNLWVGVGRFERRSSSAHARRLRSAAGSINSGRHILESRCAEHCANDAFLTSFRATLIELNKSVAREACSERRSIT